MRVEFEGEKYVVSFTHNTLDSFLRNLNVVYGNPKMGVHSASGRDLQASKYKKCLKQAFKPLMKHFKFELGTFCMIKKWEENKEETPTFAQEDPLVFEFARLSKKDTFFKKKGRSEALDKAMKVIYPDPEVKAHSVPSYIKECNEEIKKKRRAFKKAIMEACIRKAQQKEAALAAPKE